MQSRRADGHDLIIVAMKDEGWHVELLQILGEVGLRESLDAVVMRLSCLPSFPATTSFSRMPSEILAPGRL